MLHLLLLYLTLQSRKPHLSIRVSTPKAAYQAGEQVTALVSLENTGKSTVAVDRRFLAGGDESAGHEITVYVTGPNETPLPFQTFFQASRLSGIDAIDLPADEALTQPISLSGSFALSDPGTYSVQVVYDTRGIDSDIPFWRGRLVSKPAYFSIGPAASPSGSASPGAVPETSSAAPGPTAPSLSGDPAALGKLDVLLAKARRLSRHYAIGLERMEKSSTPKAGAAWEKFTHDLYGELQKTESQAVPQALAAYAIHFTGDDRIRVDPLSPADWIVDRDLNIVMGNGAFRSPAWLAASLTALQFISGNLVRWPVTAQDYHLCMALAYREVLSKTKSLGLSADDIPKILSLSRSYENELDPDHRKKMETGWPDTPQVSPVAMPEDSRLYTPPEIRASDPFFTLSLLTPDQNPVPGVPILLASAGEAGFRILETAVTDKDGYAQFDLPRSSGTALLVVPLGSNAPFPHRIPVLPAGPKEETESAPIPALSSVPQAIEPGAEVILNGKHLAENGERTMLVIGEEQSRVLAASPSILLVRVPALAAGVSPLSLSTPQGGISVRVPVAVIEAKLDKQKVRRGEQARLTVRETGAPSLQVLLSTNGPSLLFPNGTGTTTVTLRDQEPAALTLTAAQSGPFALTYSVSDPSKEKVIRTLDGFGKFLRDLPDQNRLEETRLAFEENQFARAGSLLEQLRFETLMNEGKILFTESVLP